MFREQAGPPWQWGLAHGPGRGKMCCHSPGAYRLLGLMRDGLGAGGEKVVRSLGPTHSAGPAPESCSESPLEHGLAGLWQLHSDGPRGSHGPQ